MTDLDQMALVMILPLLKEFSSALVERFSARVHTEKESRFIGDFAAFTSLLQELDTGVFPHVALEFSFDSTVTIVNEL